MRGTGEGSRVRGVVDLRGTLAWRSDLAKCSVSRLDLTSLSCWLSHSAGSRGVYLGFHATALPHQLGVMPGNAESTVVAADSESGWACLPRYG